MCETWSSDAKLPRSSGLLNPYARDYKKPISIVDKWSARIILRVRTGNNWTKIINREVIIMKVKYPFLPERQLVGKACQKFGVPAIMGSIVRPSILNLQGSTIKKLFKNLKEKSQIQKTRRTYIEKQISSKMNSKYFDKNKQIFRFVTDSMDEDSSEFSDKPANGAITRFSFAIKSSDSTEKELSVKELKEEKMMIESFKSDESGCSRLDTTDYSWKSNAKIITQFKSSTDDWSKTENHYEAIDTNTPLDENRNTVNIYKSNTERDSTIDEPLIKTSRTQFPDHTLNELTNKTEISNIHNNSFITTTFNAIEKTFGHLIDSLRKKNVKDKKKHVKFSIIKHSSLTPVKSAAVRFSSDKKNGHDLSGNNSNRSMDVSYSSSTTDKSLENKFDKNKTFERPSDKSFFFTPKTGKIAFKDKMSIEDFQQSTENKLDPCKSNDLCETEISTYTTDFNLPMLTNYCSEYDSFNLKRASMSATYTENTAMRPKNTDERKISRIDIKRRVNHIISMLDKTVDYYKM